MRDFHPSGREPTPEQLAAYGDGELDEKARAEIEAWLRDHPDAAGEAEALRRLTRLYRAEVPPEPGEAQWAAVLVRVEAGLQAAGRHEARSWRRAAGFLGTALTTAAAAVILLTVTLNWPGRSPPAPTPEVVQQIQEEPLPVLSTDEVEIISMDAADQEALVVGEPPVSGPLVLASADEVSVDSMIPEEVEDGTPDMRLVEETSTPMIVVALETDSPSDAPGDGSKGERSGRGP